MFQVSFPAAESYAQNNASGYPLIQWIHLFGVYKTDGFYAAQFAKQDTKGTTFFFFTTVSTICCLIRHTCCPHALDVEESMLWNEGIGFFGTIFWDIVLVIVLSFHRHNLIVRGLGYPPQVGVQIAFVFSTFFCWLVLALLCICPNFYP